MTDAEIIEVYSRLMSEAKTRIDTVAAILKEFDKNPSRSDGFMQLELCYLQIRFISEIIALGTAFAHSPLGLSSDFKKLYNAGKIFQALSKVNPHSFPRRIKMGRDPLQGMNVEILPSALSKDKLNEIYVSCDNNLHRGTIRRLEKSYDIKLDLQMVRDFNKQIVELLRDHAILVPSIGKFMFVRMRNEAINVWLANVAKKSNDSAEGASL